MIRLVNVKHRWSPDDPWLFEISLFECHEGERVAVIGPSGVGKSTLLAILAGWIVPTEGEVWIRGEALHWMSDQQRTEWRSRQVRWHGVSCPLLDALNVHENLLLPQWLGLAKGTVREVILTVFAELSLPDELLDQSIHTLSSGERQRVEMARCLLNPSPLMLFDEPTAHLNPTLSQEIAKVLTKHHDGSGAVATATYIIATHDDFLAGRCDHILRVIPTTERGVDQESASSPEVTQAQRVNNSILPERGAQHEEFTPLPRSLWRYVLCQLRSARRLYLFCGVITWLAITLTSLTVMVTGSLNQEITLRAQHTPLMAGGVVSPFDLLLSGLYFTSPPRDVLRWGLVDDLEGEAQQTRSPLTPILFAGYVRGFPVIGTDSSYYPHRSISISEGRLPLLLGEVVLSKGLAADLKVGLLSTLTSDLSSPHSLEAPEPVSLTVVGMIEADQGPDRKAIFTTLPTGWSVLGLSHSHQPRQGRVDASEMIDQRVDKSTLHFHLDPDQRPLTALLAFPSDPRSLSLLRARWSRFKGVSVIQPRLIAQQTLDIFARIETLLTPIFILLTSMLLLLVSIFLGQRYMERARDRAALATLGLSTPIIRLTYLLEYGAVLGVIALTLFMFWIIFVRFLDPVVLLRWIYH